MTSETFFRPPWAVTCWSDAGSIFVELPAAENRVYIMKFPHTEAGLSKVLNLLQKRKAERPLNGAKAPKLLAEPTKLRPKPTAEELATATAILRKLGMI
jgi:hypothetical protein